MSCFNATFINQDNFDTIEESIKSVLNDLISTNYPDSEIESINITRAEDGQCKYLITTKVISETEEEAENLRAYADNDSEGDTGNGLETDFANQLEEEVPEIGNIDIETQSVTITEVRNAPAATTTNDILTTELILVIALIGGFCVCCAFILFCCYREKTKKDIVAKQLELERYKASQIVMAKSTSYDSDLEELKANHVNLKQGRATAPSLKEFPTLPPEDRRNTDINNLVPALPTHVTPGGGTSVISQTDTITPGVNTADDDLAEGVPLPPDPPINGQDHGPVPVPIPSPSSVTCPLL